MKIAIKCLVIAFLLLTQLCLAQEYPPAASFYGLLRNIPSAKGGQPVWGGNFADILFAPAGEFSCKVLVKSGDQVLAEFPAKIAQRDRLDRVLNHAPFGIAEYAESAESWVP